MLLELLLFLVCRCENGISMYQVKLISLSFCHIDGTSMPAEWIAEWIAHDLVVLEMFEAQEEAFRLSIDDVDLNMEPSSPSSSEPSSSSSYELSSSSSSSSSEISSSSLSSSSDDELYDPNDPNHWSSGFGSEETAE